VEMREIVKKKRPYVLNRGGRAGGGGYGRRFIECTPLIMPMKRGGGISELKQFSRRCIGGVQGGPFNLG